MEPPLRRWCLSLEFSELPSGRAGWILTYSWHTHQLRATRSANRVVAGLAQGGCVQEDAGSADAWLTRAVGWGSICTESVGGVEPSIESPNGEELHLFLAEWQMFAANTFRPLGQGTWQSTGGNQCRSDYVCFPLQWKNGVMSCSIETE